MLFRNLMIAITMPVLLAAAGCHTTSNLAGYYTQSMPDGRQVSEIKVESKDGKYRFIYVVHLRGRCAFQPQEDPAEFADPDELSRMFGGKKPEPGVKALVSQRTGTLLIGPKGDWTVGNLHVTSGVILEGSGFRPEEVHRTDGCYSLDGVLQK